MSTWWSDAYCHQVAAKLMHEAIGDRFHAVLVNNGLLRLNEAEDVHKVLTEHLGIQLTVVDASDRFLGNLKGATDPEQKRKIIGSPYWVEIKFHEICLQLLGRSFIDVFQETAHSIASDAAESPKLGNIEWLLQGMFPPSR